MTSDSSRRVPSLIENWPVYRQLTGPDRLERGAAARSPYTEEAAPRTQAAERVTSSICPYCAVGQRRGAANRWRPLR